MNLTYTLSREDVEAAGKVGLRRLAVLTAKAKSVRLRSFGLNVVTWTALTCTSAAYMHLYRGSPERSLTLNLMLIGFVAVIALVLTAFFYRQRLYRDVMYSDGSWSRSTQSVSATPEALEMTTVGASTRYDWSRFKECAEDQLRLYLFLDASYAVVIPKSAFATPEDLALFRSWAKR